MKKILLTLVMIGLVATFINDVGRYAKTRYDLNTIAMTTADSLVTSRSETRDNNARAAARLAEAKGATVYMFDQDDASVHVWVQMPVEGTWVLAPAMAMITELPANAPYVVQDEQTAYFR